jgi:hypothetical protein
MAAQGIDPEADKIGRCAIVDGDKVARGVMGIDGPRPEPLLSAGEEGVGCHRAQGIEDKAGGVAVIGRRIGGVSAHYFTALWPRRSTMPSS